MSLFFGKDNVGTFFFFLLQSVLRTRLYTSWTAPSFSLSFFVFLKKNYIYIFFNCSHCQYFFSQDGRSSNTMALFAKDAVSDMTHEPVQKYSCGGLLLMDLFIYLFWGWGVSALFMRLYEERDANLLLLLCLCKVHVIATLSTIYVLVLCLFIRKHRDNEAQAKAVVVCFNGLLRDYIANFISSYTYGHFTYYNRNV